MRPTHLARSIDLRLPSNRLALLIGLATAAAVFAAGNGELGSLASAIRGGVASVVGWSTAREIDPDHPGSAALAASIVGVGALLFDISSLAPAFALVLATRIVVRTSGLPPTAFDYLGLALFAFVAARSVSGWLLSLTMAFAAARDHRLPEGSPQRALLGAFLIAVTATAGTVATPDPTWTSPPLSEIVVAFAGLVAGLSLRPYAPISAGDLTGRALHPSRLISGRRLVLVALSLASLLGGGGAIPTLLPGWASLIAVAIWSRIASVNQSAA